MAELFLYSDVYGYIDNVTPAAHDQSGTTGIHLVGEGPMNSEKYRAFWSFDTSVVPGSAVLSGGRLYTRLVGCSAPVGCVIGHYRIRLGYAHDRIGAAISTDDWGLGGYFEYKTWGAALPSFPDDFYWQMYSVEVRDIINKDGDTDFEASQYSLWTGCADGPTFELQSRVGLLDYTYLKLTYKMQGALSRFNLRGLCWFGPMVLRALSSLMVAEHLLPSGSRILAVEDDDILVTTTFFPRTVGACS